MSNSGNRSTSSSVVGRLLEELSWVGSKISDYRNGGRGYENVLTAEGLLGLDYLPRTRFLGEVISRAHGAEECRKRLVSEIEGAVLTLLPGDQPLAPSRRTKKEQLRVQPDGLIESDAVFAVLEAKRIRSNSFQPEQLAREFVLALRDAHNKAKAPLLLLVLGSEPPVKVVGQPDKQLIEQAIDLHLDSVLERTDWSGREHHCPYTAESARCKVGDVVCWTTWQEISTIVENQLAVFSSLDPSLKRTIERLANAVTQAIVRHG
jgi:hypothetical protein